MHTEFDVIRSVQRYTAAILRAPWDVRISLENETPVRPFALVTQNGPCMTVGHYGEHSLRKQIAMTIHLYPEEGESRAHAETIAAGLEEVLFSGIRAATLLSPPIVRRGGVVPVWDFVNDTTSGNAPPRNDPDVARIEQWATRSIADEINARRMTVVADMRLSWFRAGSVADSGSTVLGRIRAAPTIEARIYEPH